MVSNFERIREAVENEQYLIGAHALMRMDERGIPEWQIIGGMIDGHLIVERPTTCRFRQLK